MSETHTTPSAEEVHSSVDTVKQKIIESPPTDTTALDSTALEGHTHEVQMSTESTTADSQPTVEESKVSHA